MKEKDTRLAVVVNRILTMDVLISQQLTGKPERFAKKVGLSKRNLYNYLNAFRESGRPINYDKEWQTYYYPGEKYRSHEE